MQKYVYFFGGKSAEGKADMKALLGGKGANLAEMTNIKLPVPAGFTITTEVCLFYLDKNGYPDGLVEQVKSAMTKMEDIMGAKFADKENPLLLSVRSGAQASMPGMMDTILNLGLNDQTVKGLIARTNNPRFAWDCYRRFIQMYGDVVMNVRPEGEHAHDPFEEAMDALKTKRGIELDVDMTETDLQELVTTFKKIIKDKTGLDFPTDPWDQVWGAVGAVFNSWNNDRANTYRKLNNIPHTWGTAVNIQAMVFGNMGDDSGTGVAFTRNPATGEKEFYGEYLINAQGEDVVAGIRTPKPIIELKTEMPNIHKELDDVRNILELHFKDMQDFEFTIQNNRLWMLQTRNGKRTGLAAIRIAVEMVDEKLISEQVALTRIDPEQLNQLLRPIFDLKEKKKAIAEGHFLAKGLEAGPGAASGKVAFSAQKAIEMAKSGDDIILVRIETSPEDIKGMNAAVGILTARGGMTSHAALVARQMGKVCVAGCGALNIDYSKLQMEVNGIVLNEGDYLSIDGSTGEVIEGKIKTLPSEIIQVLIDKTLEANESAMYGIYSKLMSWADKVRRLKIRTNADQPDQSLAARAFGAEGIGLCRTEHMFFGGERIQAVREMILSSNEAGRRKALDKLLPMQMEDFYGIFKVMAGCPVTIRTLDPPLHEFLPHTEKEINELAVSMNVPADKLSAKVKELHEMNPMLGHRGCRLGNVYPEITEMQAKAIFLAAAKAIKEGVQVMPEIMIPLVGFVEELRLQEKIVRKAAADVIKSENVNINYLVGTMIELPRACMVANQIAEVAEFFSFGTNDLTQTTLGISRDDSQGFLPYYLEHEIFKNEPFQTIDTEGVGQLMHVAVERGRNQRSNLKIGICGEHGGDPRSVVFCHQLGLDYVSCSPYRIPIARLSAAQAVLKDK